MDYLISFLISTLYHTKVPKNRANSILFSLIVRHFSKSNFLHINNAGGNPFPEVKNAKYVNAMKQNVRNSNVIFPRNVI